MARQIVHLGKLMEAQEAADAAMEAATLAAEKVAAVIALASPTDDGQTRQQVGARVTATVYRQLKAKAALQGVAVGALVEQAIAEFLARGQSTEDAA